MGDQQGVRPDVESLLPRGQHGLGGQVPGFGRVPCRVHDAELWFAETPEAIEAARPLSQACPTQDLATSPHGASMGLALHDRAAANAGRPYGRHSGPDRMLLIDRSRCSTGPSWSTEAVTYRPVCIPRGLGVRRCDPSRPQRRPSRPDWVDVGLPRTSGTRGHVSLHVLQVKAGASGDVTACGGLRFAPSSLAARAVDEVQPYANPGVVGDGTRPFTPALGQLQVLGSTASRCGMVVTRDVPKCNGRSGSEE
jgi:hypothetical protein